MKKREKKNEKGGVEVYLDSPSVSSWCSFRLSESCKTRPLSPDSIVDRSEITHTLTQIHRGHIQFFYRQRNVDFGGTLVEGWQPQKVLAQWLCFFFSNMVPFKLINTALPDHM